MWRQLHHWDERGRQELDDLPGFNACIGDTRWFGDRPRLQTTWAQLIRILLSARGLPADAASVLEYQVDRLGRRDGETCLMELLPLPSQSTAHWRYGEWSKLPYLESRKAYVDHFARMRAEYIRERLIEHKPRIVVMYGLSGFARQCWELIAGMELTRASGFSHHASFGADEETSYVVTAPAAWGVRDQHFSQVGSLLRDR